MKKILYVVAAVSIAAACTQKELPCTVINASIGAEQSKTVLGPAEGIYHKILWSAGDRISLNGVASNPLDASQSGSQNAEFIVPGSISAPYTVVYPASACSSMTSVTFGDTQVHTPGSFAQGAAILAARSETADVSFCSLCSFLRLNITRSGDLHDIRTIIFKGNDNEVLSGEFPLVFEAGKVSLGTPLSGGKQITLTCCQQTGEYIIALPAITLAKGFTVEIQDEKNHFMRAVTNASLVLDSNVIMNAPALDFKPTGTHIGGGISDVTEEDNQLTITWDRENAVSWTGGYGRVHRLNDGRLMAVYSAQVAQGCYRFSSDNGKTWTAEKKALLKYKHTFGEEVTWSNIANCEFAQLSATNPYHPNRIIYAGNIRPSGQRSDLIPYSICYVTSDDAGQTWSGRKIAYESKVWSEAVTRGCWEPFVLELPDGTVQIYFADETPYYSIGRTYQNISVVESKDGGDTWSDVRIAAYTSLMRDGMPVVMLYNDRLYLAIEHIDGYSQKLHPQIAHCTLSSNWNPTVTNKATMRFDPMMNKLDYMNEYFGAPYLITTDNYLVLSYQSSVGRDTSVQEEISEHAVMEVVACLKSEMNADGTFPYMRGASRPVIVDQTTGKARWPSLCHLGGDEILAVADCDNTIVITKGVISGK